MPTKYCSHASCFAKIDYPLGTTPTSCPKCHREFVAAFQVVPVASSTPKQEYAPQESQTRGSHRTHVSKGRNPTYDTHLRPHESQNRQEPIYDDDDGGDDGSGVYVSRQQARSEAMALAAQIRPSDFTFGVESDSVRGEDILAEAKRHFEQQQAAAPTLNTKRTRKKA